MNNKFVIHFDEENLKISELEGKLNFIKSLPIEVTPESEKFDIYFGFSGVNIYPAGKEMVNYKILQGIGNCEIVEHLPFVSIIRKNNGSSEQYCFFKKKT